MGHTLDDAPLAARESAPAWSGPVPGQPVSTLGQFDLGRLGYTSQEWFLAGKASAWRASGALDDDGRWAVDRAGSAPFETRLLVCRPADPARFNGTVGTPALTRAATLPIAAESDGTASSRTCRRHCGLRLDVSPPVRP
jgi:Alpha/beta hydrolase domain